jgi:hypothetical protein
MWLFPGLQNMTYFLLWLNFLVSLVVMWMS